MATYPQSKITSSIIAWMALGFIFMLNAYLFWPGLLTPDSMGQYAEAKNGVYSDHHPAVMALIWHYLDLIMEGPGLMLLLHLGLFYSALVYGIKIFQHSALKYIYVALPLIPGVLIYSGMIWKDVGYAFSFLLAGMVLCYAISSARPFKYFEQALFWGCLFYGAAVKYQGQFIVLVLIIGYLYHHTNFWRQYRALAYLKSLGIVGLFYGCFYLFHYWLVPPAQQSYSWQYVKLYDLGGISVDINEDLFPNAVKNSNFTMERLHQRVDHLSVDETVFGKDAILKKGATEEERHELWWAWAKAVVKHPISYLKHRIWNYAHVLFSVPGYNHVQNISNKILNPHWSLYRILTKCIRLASYLFFGHITVALISIFYCILGLLTFKRTWHGQALLILNGVSVAMLGFLFFFSMAGTPRYTYIVMCLTHASHAFAWMCWIKNRHKAL